MSGLFDLLGYTATLRDVDPHTIDRFSAVLPAFLLDEWREHGFASYLGGLLMTTDPRDLTEVVADWVDDPGDCHVILRSAFGHLFYLRDGRYYSHGIVHDLSADLRSNLEFVVRFSLMDAGYQEHSLYRSVYTRAARRLGPPAYDEVYAFVPAIALGGTFDADHVQKVKLAEHAALLAQLR